MGAAAPHNARIHGSISPVVGRATASNRVVAFCPSPGQRREIVFRDLLGRCEEKHEILAERTQQMDQERSRSDRHGKGLAKVVDAVQVNQTWAAASVETIS